MLLSLSLWSVSDAAVTHTVIMSLSASRKVTWHSICLCCCLFISSINRRNQCDWVYSSNSLDCRDQWGINLTNGLTPFIKLGEVLIGFDLKWLYKPRSSYFRAPSMQYQSNSTVPKIHTIMHAHTLVLFIDIFRKILKGMLCYIIYGWAQESVISF